MGKADGRCIPILWVSILFNDVCGGNIVVSVDVLGQESLSGSLSGSYMVQGEDI